MVSMIFALLHFPRGSDSVISYVVLFEKEKFVDLTGCPNLKDCDCEFTSVSDLENAVCHSVSLEEPFTRDVIHDIVAAIDQ